MNFLDQVKGKLIVSCQALMDEPLHSPFIMGRMALAAKQGGATAIRAQGVADINEIKKITSLPVIGIIKKNYPDSEIYITPTKEEITQLLTTQCEMIALDATNRDRPNHETLSDLLSLIHQNNRLAMADISTFEEALTAQQLGFDCVSSTLVGYTSYSDQIDGPHLSLLQQLTNELTIPVIAEGKIHSPEDLYQVLCLPVHSVVVGGAITRPQQITKRFVDQFLKRKDEKNHV